MKVQLHGHLKTIELYTLIGWNLWYINCISKNMFKEENKTMFNHINTERTHHRLTWKEVREIPLSRRKMIKKWKCGSKQRKAPEVGMIICYIYKNLFNILIS